MKYAPILLALCFSVAAHCQQAVSEEDVQLANFSSGGDATGKGGSVAFSIGQVFFTIAQNQDAYILPGVQQVIPENIETILPENPSENFNIFSYPNPVKDYLIIDIQGLNGSQNIKQEELAYQIYDMGGRIILSGDLPKSNNKISPKQLLPGSYFLTITGNGLQLKTIKIIKI